MEFSDICHMSARVWGFSYGHKIRQQHNFMHVCVYCIIIIMWFAMWRESVVCTTLLFHVPHSIINHIIHTPISCIAVYVYA